MAATARVVVMDRAAGAPAEGLTSLLGADRAAELDRVLLARAKRWAAEVAGPDKVVSSGKSRVHDVLTQLFAAGDGPVLLAWPELVTWRPGHAEGALEDLEDGCAASFGPMFDGGFYLVAVAQPIAALQELTDDAWRSSDPIALAAGAAREAELAIGLLRTERGLRKPADVRALLADPLLDRELRALLR
jgi:hypothetical protein